MSKKLKSAQIGNYVMVIFYAQVWRLGNRGEENTL
jgi:hypothetical protein